VLLSLSVSSSNLLPSVKQTLSKIIFGAQRGMIRSMTMVWAGHVARVWKLRSACKMLIGKLEQKGYFVDFGVNGRII
jgi:hypothetical protein